MTAMKKQFLCLSADFSFASPCIFFPTAFRPRFVRNCESRYSILVRGRIIFTEVIDTLYRLTKFALRERNRTRRILRDDGTLLTAYPNVALTSYRSASRFPNYVTHLGEVEHDQKVRESSIRRLLISFLRVIILRNCTSVVRKTAPENDRDR